MLVARERFDYYELPPQKQNNNSQSRVRKVRKARANNKKGYCVAVIVTLILAFWLTSRHAEITSTSYELIALNKQAQNLTVENQSLQSQVDELNSLDNIEYIATTKLGMQKPETAEGVQFVPVEYKTGSKVIASKADNAQNIKTKQNPKRNFLVQALAKIING